MADNENNSNQVLEGLDMIVKEEADLPDLIFDENGECLTEVKVEDENVDSLFLHTETMCSESLQCTEHEKITSSKSANVFCSRNHGGPFKHNVPVHHGVLSPKSDLSERTLKVKPFSCNQCEKGFSRKYDLGRHLTTHSVERPYKCDVCQKAFHQKYNLAQHSKIHSEEKLFKCYVCQKGYIRNSNLTKHLQIHSPDNPFKCVVCQKAFKQKCTLTAHLKTHSQVKPFRCSKCEKEFTRKYDCTRHYLTKHTGLRPYKCGVCQKAFIQKHLLSKHLQIHYRETLLLVIGTRKVRKI